MSSDDFELANKAYGLMTLSEKLRVLEICASLRYLSVKDRFFEAVHQVICEKSKAHARRKPMPYVTPFTACANCCNGWWLDDQGHAHRCSCFTAWQAKHQNPEAA